MNYKRILCFIVAALMIALTLTSCSSEGKALFTFRGTELSTNMYSYMISSQKAYLKQLFDYYNYMSYMYYGTYYFQTTDFDEYLRSEQADENGNVSTVAEITNNMIIESAKYMVVINHLCEQYDLELTDESLIADIEDVLSEDIETAGNMEYLNILLAQFGADYDIERKYMYDSAMANVLYEHLYGKGGERRLADSIIKSEFESKFYKMDVLYYAYYSSNAETGEQSIRDVENISAEMIYDYIAPNYAKVNQILLYTIDVNTMNKLSEDKIAAKKETIDDIYAQLQNGSITFEEAKSQISEDSGSGSVIVAKEGNDARIQNVVDAAFELNAGEYVLVESEIGYHIILREEMTQDDIPNEIKTEAAEILAKGVIDSYAEAAYEKAQNGALAFSDYSGEETRPDPYGKYSGGIVFTKGELEDEIYDKVAGMANDEYALIKINSGVCVIRKMALTDNDLTDRYDEIYSELAEAAFKEFIMSFYPEITIDEEELSKYDFLTAVPLELVPLKDE